MSWRASYASAGGGDAVEHPLQRLPQGGRRWAGASGQDGWPEEVEQVGALGIVELQRSGDGVQDAVGRAGDRPAFELRVVVDADAGEEGDLLTSQARHAPLPVAGQHARLGGVMFALGWCSDLARDAAEWMKQKTESRPLLSPTA